MTKQALNIPAGKLFCIATGEYSGYSYIGHFLALEDITPVMFEEVVTELCNLNEEYAWDDLYEKYIAALIKRGWVLSIDCTEIHIGSYGILELS